MSERRNVGNRMRTILRDEREFVRFIIERNNYKLLPSGGFNHGEGLSDTASRFFMDYREIIRTSRSTVPRADQLTKSMVKDALYEWVADEIPKVRLSYIEPLKCETEDLGPLYDFCKIMLNKDEVKFEAHCLAHFIWQVKRKALGKKVKNHLCPIFYGPQGYGKSVAIRRLTSPVEPYVYNISAKELNTIEKIGFKLADSLVAFMDELEGLNKADANAVKNVITAKNLDVRKYHSQDFISVPQLSTFIGATNNPLTEVFYDPTGMRRFVEIKAPMDKMMDVEAIDNFDVVSIWRGVDEKREREYIKDIWEDLNRHQKDLTPAEYIESFLTEKGLVNINEYQKVFPDVVPSDLTPYEIPLDELFQLYKDWAKVNDYPSMNKQNFGKRLTNKGFEKRQVRNKRTGGRPIYYTVTKRAVDALNLQSKAIKRGEEINNVVNLVQHKEV